MPKKEDETLGDALIPIINKLQDIFSQVTLDFRLNLPQVAVIGSQSSGKSSVLEALVGRDFLPRGPEICTRRPLVLQLVKVSASAASGKPAEWGEFLHAPGKLFHDFDRIRQEIMSETERVTGSNKGVSEKPIRLKICSPHVLTMTLVDLPGMTKVPVGDQPSNIEQRIRDMVLEYIRPPSAIILAVSPANVDLVNSDALQLAKLVDPEGIRTIGVVTKLDIMDRGTNAVAVLKNTVVPLRLGYVGVVNRSQDDINKARSMADARTAEEGFFLSHPDYSEVAAQCGTAHLARRLNSILVQHIAALLPALRRRIEDAAELRAAELRLYGEEPPATSGAARGALLLQLLSDYSNRFNSMLDGKCEDMPTSELAGGARIRHVFQEDFVKRVAREINPPKDLTDETIRTAITNSAGVSGVLLIPQEPFEVLVRRSIQKLQAPAVRCKELVLDELLRIAAEAAPRDLGRFPNLQRHLSDAVQNFIAEGANPAERMIKDLVECELGYINTDHPEFIGGSRAVQKVMEELHLRKHARKQEAAAAEAAAKEAARKPHTGQNGDAKAQPPHASAVQASIASRSLGLRVLPDDPFANSEDIVVPKPLRNKSVEESTAAAEAAVPGNTAHWLTNWFTRENSRPSSDSELSAAAAAAPPARLPVSKPRSEQEEAEVEIIRLLVGSYFDIVRKTLQDAVPKAIMHFLVNHCQRGMHQHLIRALYREELFEDMMKERDDLVAKRRACSTLLAALRQAATALAEIPAELSRSIPMAAAANEEALMPSYSLTSNERLLDRLDRHPSMNVAARIAERAATGYSSAERPGSTLGGFLLGQADPYS